MMMRGHDEFDRLRSNAFHLGHDLVMILFVFIVHQDHALIGDVNRDIAAVTLDLIKIVLHLIQLQLGWLLGLGVSHPGAEQKQRSAANTYEV